MLSLQLTFLYAIEFAAGTQQRLLYPVTHYVQLHVLAAMVGQALQEHSTCSLASSSFPNSQPIEGKGLNVQTGA